MGLSARITSAISSLRSFVGCGPTGGGGHTKWWMPERTENWAKAAGNASDNSICSICFGFIARKFIEGKGVTQRASGSGDNVKWATLHGDPLTALLNSNPFYDARGLWALTSVDLSRGNAYWIIVPSQAGNPVELWWAPRQTMRPYIVPGENNDLPICWEYKPGNGKTYYLPLEDVIHFKGLQPDPANLFIGLDPLIAQNRHLAADNEISAFPHRIVRNMGIPGVLFVPKEQYELGPNAKKDLKRSWREKTTGESIGDAMVLDAPYDVVFPNVTPDKMALDELGDPSEERIPAALGLNAMALGLGAGLKRSTYSNYEESLEAAFDNGISPLHTIAAATVTERLVPLVMPAGRTYRYWFDCSEIPALQEDENERHDRVRKDFVAGVITIGQACEALRLPEPTEPDARVWDMKPAPAAPGALPAPDGAKKAHLGGCTCGRCATKAAHLKAKAAKFNYGKDDVLAAIEGAGDTMRNLMLAGAPGE